MTNPHKGGSYRRNPDGSLTRIEAEAPIAIQPEAAAVETTNETPDAGDETSTKKGKA